MKKALIAILFGLLFVTTGCFNSGNTPVEDKKPETPVPAMQVVLYFPDKDMNKLVAEKRHVTDKSMEKAVNELIKGSSDGQTLFPKGTQCLGVSTQNGVAIVNFNNEILKIKNQLGSGPQLLWIASIANTLTEFDGVSAVKIAVVGKPLRVLGNLDLTEPVGRSEDLIAK